MKTRPAETSKPCNCGEPEYPHVRIYGQKGKEFARCEMPRSLTLRTQITAPAEEELQ